MSSHSKSSPSASTSSYPLPPGTEQFLAAWWLIITEIGGGALLIAGALTPLIAVLIAALVPLALLAADPRLRPRPCRRRHAPLLNSSGALGPAPLNRQ